MYITKFLFQNLRNTESTFNIEQLSAELQNVSPILITEKHTNLIIGGLSLCNINAGHKGTRNIGT
jgi:hypothetical protein